MRSIFLLCASSLLLHLSLFAASAPAQALLHELASPNEETSGFYGASVAAVPDVDGDGRTDFIVAARGDEPIGSPEGAGRVYLHSGASGALLRELSSPNEELGGGFGWSVAGVSDLDGDGRGELLIGTFDESQPPSPAGAGRAYVFGGATGALLYMLMSPNEQAQGEFGTAVASVPDADGDGRDDLLIGAMLESPGSSLSLAGRAHLFSGATGSLLYTLASPDEKRAGNFGSAVAGLDDVDGDGRGDLLIGAYGEKRGRIHGFSGATGALLYTIESPNLLTLNGKFGYALARVNDIDGDGRGEFLVGSYDEDSGMGRAYLYRGVTASLIHEFISPHAQDFGYFGFAVSAVNDTDGDSLDDLLVGAFQENPAGAPEKAGRAYLFSGGTGAMLEEFTSPNEETSGAFGVSVAGLADADGDGRGDLLVGAYLEDPGASPSDAGRAYVFAGGDAIVLTLEADPGNPPIIIPAAGGTFAFSATVTNTGPDSETFQLWTRLTFPDGKQTRDGLGPITQTLGPGASFTYRLKQRISGRSPAGTYTYSTFVGTYPDGSVASDSFHFTKEPAAPAVLPHK